MKRAVLLDWFPVNNEELHHSEMNADAERATQSIQQMIEDRKKKEADDRDAMLASLFGRRRMHRFGAKRAGLARSRPGIRLFQVELAPTDSTSSAVASSARSCGIQHDAIVQSSQAARLSPRQERSARA